MSTTTTSSNKTSQKNLVSVKPNTKHSSQLTTLLLTVIIAKQSPFEKMNLKQTNLLTLV